MKTLTTRQQEVLDYITGLVPPPTHREVANHFGYKSVQSATRILYALEYKGKIEIKFGIARGVIVK